MIGPVRRVPLGKAIRRTEAQRELLAMVTPGDVDRARLLWHELAPAKYRKLIDSAPTPKGVQE